MSPEQLFPRANREFLTLLASLPKHLDAAMPMRQQHRRSLPKEIRNLSHMLTDEREDMRPDYLADPATLSAYLRYFLPWNVYRLGTLFGGLALDPGGDNLGYAATIVDLGAGPLTAPLALWMSRPRLRRRPLHFICVDRALKPMRLGLDVLTHLAEAHGGLAPWKITLVKGPLDAHLRERADLLIMANALNEVLHRGEGELLESAESMARHLVSQLTPAGSILVVEPGVRPSAHLMAALRRGFLHHGLLPLAPCPHTEPCPMSGRGYTAWCHFNFDAEAAPSWLKKLSDEARLPKDNVSLSFLNFSAKGRKLEAAPGKSFVRAVSGPFELPFPNDVGSAPRRFGQYACSDHGLTLLTLPRKHLLPLSGALLEAAWPAVPETDAKSGGLLLPLGVEPMPAMAAQVVGAAAGAVAFPAEAGTEATAKAPVEATPEVAPKAAKKWQPVKPQRKGPRLPSERPAQREPSYRKLKAPKAADLEASQPTNQPGGQPGSQPGNTFSAPADVTYAPEGKPAAAEGQPTEKSGPLAGLKRAKKSSGKSGIPANGYPDDLFTDESAREGDRRPSNRPAKKKPGKAPVKKVNKPKAKKGGKSTPKADSRAARKAKKS